MDGEDQGSLVALVLLSSQGHCPRRLPSYQVRLLTRLSASIHQVSLCSGIPGFWPNFSLLALLLFLIHSTLEPIHLLLMTSALGVLWY